MIGTLFAALYAAHMVGDHWVQTSAQAGGKGAHTHAGRMACLGHVVTLTLTKLTAVLAAVLASGMDVQPWALTGGLLLDAASHYWADRRFTLAGLAKRTGKAEFYALGAPRGGQHDDNPSLGTGAYALDQSWHIGWLFVAAVICSL